MMVYWSLAQNIMLEFKREIDCSYRNCSRADLDVIVSNMIRELDF